MEADLQLLLDTENRRNISVALPISAQERALNGLQMFVFLEGPFRCVRILGILGTFEKLPVTMKNVRSVFTESWSLVHLV